MRNLRSPPDYQVQRRLVIFNPFRCKVLLYFVLSEDALIVTGLMNGVRNFCNNRRDISVSSGEGYGTLDFEEIPIILYAIAQEHIQPTMLVPDVKLGKPQPEVGLNLVVLGAKDITMVSHQKFF